MDALSIAQWKTSHPHAFLALSLTLPDRTVRLTSGGTVTFGGNTYVPEDSAIGVFSQVGAFNEGEVDSATAPDLTFEAYTDAGVEDLANADIQGSPWTLYWGVVNPSTGAVVGTPIEWTSGFLNVGSVAFAEGTRTIVFTSYTLEQLQLVRRGVRLAEDPVLRPLMSRLTRKIYWRADQPRGGAGSGSGGGGAIGGGNGNDLVQRF